MKRILLTGISGTGKSIVVAELRARGYKAVETDDELGEWVSVAGGVDELDGSDREWLWREDAMQRLLSTEDSDVLFVSGCARNQVAFYPQFDHVVLLSAPTEVIVERLATRTTNPYGKLPDELALILRQQEGVVPMLRHDASSEVDTSAPVDEVVRRILESCGLPAESRE